MDRYETTLPPLFGGSDDNDMSIGHNPLNADAVASTPVGRPTPGSAYEHLNHGYVRVHEVEDGQVVFGRPGRKPTTQPVAQFRAQTVEVS